MPLFVLTDQRDTITLLGFSPADESERRGLVPRKERNIMERLGIERVEVKLRRKLNVGLHHLYV